MNNNYESVHISETVRSLAIAAILAAQFAVVTPADCKMESGSLRVYGRGVYETSATSPTFDQYRGAITGEYMQGDSSLEEVVSDFYAKFLSSQEPLGEAFEKVLYRNLWDLYEV